MAQDQDVDPPIPGRDPGVELDDQALGIGSAVDQQPAAPVALDQDRVPLADVEDRDMDPPVRGSACLTAEGPARELRRRVRDGRYRLVPSPATGHHLWYLTVGRPRERVVDQLLSLRPDGKRVLLKGRADMGKKGVAARHSGGAYHTDSEEDTPVYHNRPDCSEGQKIEPKHVKPGRAGRTDLCDICKGLWAL
jgi:hypothetical protein